ncbi:MAG: hydroxymethylglutaryl-CoA reductase, degradative [Halobacteriota archaeon]|nr:hydroxymethylglutaryl-CoA reductase, degradative [Halobacteriota archaeon]
MVKTSRVSGFFKLSVKERMDVVKDFADLTDEEVNNIDGQLEIEQADRMVENVIGKIDVPLGVATNFLINGKDYLIPMAIEEPSVIAAAGNAAKMARDRGGFTASSTGPVMIGQIQVVDVIDPYAARFGILEKKDKIIKLANEQDPFLIKVGGGAIDVEVRVVATKSGPMIIVHLIVDCRDAMGANTVNTMSEAVSPLIEEITGGKALLRIISNLADKRLMRARAIFSKEAIGGEDVVDSVVRSYHFAEADIYRAATHNKGVMNGITAVVLATGNDTRAVESGVHTYACRSGVYKPVTVWEKNSDGDLVGTIEIPIAAGLVGGATKTHPTAKAAVKILGVKSATELGEVMASVGLAQNFAAMRALATEGIQRGHMSLHAKNIAISAGAQGDLVDKIAGLMVKERAIRIDRAKELLDELCK